MKRNQSNRLPSLFSSRAGCGGAFDFLLLPLRSNVYSTCTLGGEPCPNRGNGLTSEIAFSADASHALSPEDFATLA